MKTPDFTAENLLGAIVNMGADPFIVETEEQAAQVAESINNSNGYDILTGDDLATAREQLDCPGARKVYAFVDGSGFIVCLSQDWDYMETMQDLADYINDCEDWPTNVEDIIEQRGWVSDCDTEFGICHNDTEKVIVNDDGEAVVVPITTKNKWHEMPESAKVANLKEINETYDFSKYDAETAAYNVRMGYENDPDWFHFIVDDLNDFEREVAELLTRFF